MTSGDKRFEAIGSILSNPRPADAAPSRPHLVPAEPPASDADPEAEQTEKRANETRKRAPGTAPRRATAPSKAEPKEAQRIVFRLKDELHSALVARVHRENSSKTLVVLDALEAAHDSGTLKDLVRAEQAPQDTQHRGLFKRPQAGRKASPTIPTEIGLRGDGVSTLDRLVKTSGAANRTELVVAALQGYLADGQDTDTGTVA